METSAPYSGNQPVEEQDEGTLKASPVLKIALAPAAIELFGQIYSPDKQLEIFKRYAECHVRFQWAQALLLAAAGTYTVERIAKALEIETTDVTFWIRMWEKVGPGWFIKNPEPPIDKQILESSTSYDSVSQHQRRVTALTLTHEQEKELRYFARKTSSDIDKKHIRIVLLAGEGKTPQEIAEEVDRSPAKVIICITDYAHRGVAGILKTPSIQTIEAMPIPFTLSEENIKELNDALFNDEGLCPMVRQQIQTALLLAEGIYTKKDIAKVINATTDSIDSWTQRLHKKGMAWIWEKMQHNHERRPFKRRNHGTTPEESATMGD